MMLFSSLNRIAVRIAMAIVLAIVLGLATAVAVNNGLRSFGYGEAPPGGKGHFMMSGTAIVMIYPQQNPMMLAGKIAMVIRAMAAASPAERSRLAAGFAEPGLQIDDDLASRPDLSGTVDEHVDWLCRLVRIQLEDIAPRH